ncbi:hypothetical protein P3T76_003185 [Phytophthora citrophthora]|uniref:Transmembrane protein n=1 Tax=Phytophthora citrophthora TaxID=4793 RepID=A0AAD9GWT0_9STRA|nr:hypothetical protein P3T76_003185 [Phytophthora citrophthora]
MPPPSLERKEQPLSWQQKDKLKGPFKSEDRPRRRSSFQLPPVPFTPEPKQNSYTEQFRRRRSQQEQVDQSPRTNGKRRVERRRSNEDVGERKSLQETEEENGYHHSLAAMDTTVEKKLSRTSEDVVAAMSGKGSDCPIDQDQRKTTKAMTKKRRAPCGRSTVALAAAGVATVIVAGGFAVCYLYPTSPAATSIRIVIRKMEQNLVLLLNNEAIPLAMTLKEVVREKGMMLLRSRRLMNLARAADALVEEKLRGSLELARWTPVSFELVEDAPEHLRSAVWATVEVLKLFLEGIQAHLQTLFEFIKQQMGEDSELLDRVRALISSLTEVLNHCEEWTTSQLTKFGVIDGRRSSDQFLSLLEGNRAVIQSIGEGISTQESQTLQEVQRLEKHRDTVASATDEILLKTRDFALESIASVKMAALDAIELRGQQRYERIRREFDQALEESKQITRQLELEGWDESEVERQARMIVMKQFLMTEGAVDKKVVDLVAEEQESFQAESNDKCSADHDEEEQENIVSPTAPIEQGATEVLNLGVEEDIRVSIEVAMEGQVTIETLVVESTRFDDSLENEELVQGHASRSLDDDTCEDEDQGVKETLVTVKDMETGEEEGSVIAEVLMDTTSMNDAVVEHTVSTFESHNVSGGDVLTLDGTRLHVVIPGEGTDMELDVEVEKVAYESTEQVGVERVTSDVRTRIAIQPVSVETEIVEEQQSDELLPQAENVLVHEEVLVASDVDVEVQSEKVDTEVIFNVEKDASEVDTVFTVREDVGKTEAESLSHDTTVKQEVPDREASPLKEIARELHAVSEQQAKELQELEQLEQALLEKEGELVEEELRAIAEEEELWSRTDQALPADRVTNENPGLTEVVEVPAELKSDSWQSSLDIPKSALPGSVLMQIGMFSVTFIGLAVLTAYLLIRYRKRAQAPRRRRRWRKLAEIDAEVVVLLPEASSDEEDDKEQASMDVLELISSISVKTTTVLTSDDEKADDEEKPSDITGAQVESDQEEENTTPVSESVSSQTTAIEHFQTTVENTTTPRSDASADSIDTTHVSVSTPPALRLQTPDTSQRTSRRRHQIRT